MSWQRAAARGPAGALALALALTAAPPATAAPQGIRAASTQLELRADLEGACICDASTMPNNRESPRCEELCLLPHADFHPSATFERVLSALIYLEGDAERLAHLHVLTRPAPYDPERALSEQLGQLVGGVKASVGRRSRGLSDPDAPYDLYELGELMVARCVLLAPEDPVLLYVVLGTVDVTILTLRNVSDPPALLDSFGAELLTTLRVSTEVPMGLPPRPKWAQAKPDAAAEGAAPSLRGRGVLALILISALGLTLAARRAASP